MHEPRSGGPDELVPLIARIAGSQFAAALGIVSGVIVTALAFEALWRHQTGSAARDAGPPQAISH